MGLIYVTGIAGSGKSAVCDELLRLGYEAHEADHNLSFFYNNKTGEIVKRPLDASKRTVAWRSQHTWKMSRDKLLALKEGAKTKPVFVCGVASNEDEYIDVFDKVFASEVDTETMMRRVETRTGSDFGKTEIEKKALYEWHQSTYERYKKIKAQRVDATQPLLEVVNTILSFI